MMPHPIFVVYPTGQHRILLAENLGSSFYHRSNVEVNESSLAVATIRAISGVLLPTLELAFLCARIFQSLGESF